MTCFLPSRHFRHVAASMVYILLSLTLLVPAVQAGGKSKTPKERDYKQYYDEVVSVDQAAHTVTVATMVKEVPIGNPANAKPKADQQEKVTIYKVTNFSEIEVNGKKGDLSALTKGTKVEVTKGMDADTASRIVTKQ